MKLTLAVVEAERNLNLRTHSLRQFPPVDWNKHGRISFLHRGPYGSRNISNSPSFRRAGQQEEGSLCLETV